MGWGVTFNTLENTQSHHLQIQIRNYNWLWFSVSSLAKIKVSCNLSHWQECKRHSWLETDTASSNSSQLKFKVHIPTGPALTSLHRACTGCLLSVFHHHHHRPLVKSVLHTEKQGAPLPRTLIPGDSESLLQGEAFADETQRSLHHCPHTLEEERWLLLLASSRQPPMLPCTPHLGEPLTPGNSSSFWVGF